MQHHKPKLKPQIPPHPLPQIITQIEAIMAEGEGFGGVMQEQVHSLWQMGGHLEGT
jgi:hypothetical protein